jgi:predicted nuclease of predicted toxin-antitoxin system
VRFLLDENFPRSVATILLERAHETLDLRSVGLLGASDAVVAEKAIEAGAVILSTDRDFFHTIPSFYAEHPGVVVIALRQPSRARITERLEWFLHNVSEEHWRNRVFQLRDTTWLARPPIS